MASRFSATTGIRLVNITFTPSLDNNIYLMCCYFTTRFPQLVLCGVYDNAIIISAETRPNVLYRNTYIDSTLNYGNIFCSTQRLGKMFYDV